MGKTDDYEEQLRRRAKRWDRIETIAVYALGGLAILALLAIGVFFLPLVWMWLWDCVMPMVWADAPHPTYWAWVVMNIMLGLITAKFGRSRD